ncbi:S1/P1 nuclease [Inhella crocodyli]|uniref:Endonuclease n=1 Tax=Inhella crocodyli TaxID=2499851 RepID=A0A437LAT5_9BURK|nr:S1/P1 nuclease [Inhella crocodyli]RVT82452.1 endonuclease [Inhella crocodyli]
MMKRSRTFYGAVASVAMSLLGAHSSSHAWGAIGHELIAEVAEEQLSPATKAKVDAILAAEPGATMVTIATWADRVRSPSTAAWHYVNFTREAGCDYDRSRDCPDGKCVVEAIKRQVEVLRTSTDPEERLKALKWVVHLVGDVHQPLHAAFGDDKGGNLFQIQAFGKGGNLHSLWDSGLFHNWPGGWGAIRAEVGRAGKLVAEAAPERWAGESCRIVSTVGFYPDGRFIDDSYLSRWQPVITERLRLSASRLASTLEDALR